MRDPSSIDPWGDLAPGESLNAAFENSERGLGNTDYFDLHYKNYSFKHNHNLSFSGGSKKAQYYVSGGYYNEDGICAMLIWTIHAIRLMPISLQN